MKCHYEVLGVARDVNEEDLKKTYRKLALRWHPDKNLDNVEEAKEQFQLVQQAYEVLSDPHERAFYDKHREAIIRGGHDGDYQDDSLDVFPYFTSSCFKGYGDDEKGFYSVYREVFNKISAEDIEFRSPDDSDFEVPSFGDSQSCYEEIVHPFYAYWQSYTTKKSYAWLDPYDIREAPNRRVVRMIEKENKKVRDKARKERNEEVRNLVSFVRKRDKRVQAHIKLLEERAALNVKKNEERRKQQLLEKQAALKDYKESEWAKFSNIEHELKQIEARMAAEFGESEDSTISGDEDVEQLDEAQWVASTLYCVACKKLFKTEKAFVNHENSKKHKENVELLKGQVLDEEDVVRACVDSPSQNGIGSSVEDKTKDGQDSDVEEEPDMTDASKAKKKKKKRKSKIVVSAVNSEDSDSNIDFLLAQSRKQRKKQQRQNSIQEVPLDDVDTSPLADGDVSDLEEESQSQKRKGKKPKPETKPTVGTEETTKVTEDVDKTKSKGWKAKEVRRKARKDAEAATCVKDVNLCCVTCHTEFPSKNKLFDHLKKTGHSVYLPKATAVDIKSEEKGRKSRKK